MSRSWCVPQLGQSHSRIFNGILSTMCPQLPHRFELGNHRSILIKVRPYHSHLYSSCLTNSPQLASLMARASLGFLIMFFTAKFKGGDGASFRAPTALLTCEGYLFLHQQFLDVLSLRRVVLCDGCLTLSVSGLKLSALF